MIVVSDDFKAAMKEPVKELQAFINADDLSITSADDLISFKVSCDSGLCKSAMRKLDAKYLGEHNLVGKWVTAGFGVKLASGTYEYLNYGSFLVSEQTVTKDTGITEIVAYDTMINAMQPYSVIDVQYPIDLYTYTKTLCAACGLELGNTSFEINGDWPIERELWGNINGITYRDIFVQIAQATATTCIIGNDDKVYFKPITATMECLSYDNMMKLKLEPRYGEINSVVLSRAPQEDNIYINDEESINVYGLTEFRIENNEIVDKDRENAIVGIAEGLFTISLFPFETTTEGLGWYEIADHFGIENDTGDVFSTTLFSYSITIDGSIKETLKTTVESKAQTQYQYAKGIEKRVRNAEIIVNKQDQTIQSLVSDMYDEDGVVNEKYTKIYQDIDKIVQSVQNSGGNNIIKNSVMFAFDSEGKPNDWEMTPNGTVKAQSDVDAITAGGVSGYAFTLDNAGCRQTVKLKPHTEDDPSTYSLSVRIKKSVDGSCKVRLYNDNEEFPVVVPVGTSANYTEYVIEDIKPSGSTYTIEAIATNNGVATFTDLMLNAGGKSPWAQANGEVMNTQVIVSVDGIQVKSSLYEGDYTVMSPLEFAGYSKIGGTLTKVFCLNKATTTVKELEAEDEITMSPIKVVPITSGDIQGWAFVPTD